MADDLTNREIARELDRLADRQKAQDDRITQLAANTVPLSVHNAAIAGLAKDIADESATSREAHREIRGEMDRLRAEGERASIERHRTAMDAITDARKTLLEVIGEMKSSLVARSQMTRQQWLTLAGIIGGIVAAIIGAYVSSKGIK